MSTAAERDHMAGLIEAALGYAQIGWEIFPLHTPDDNGRCSCGSACGNRNGKHPRTRHGLNDATTNEDQIRRWWKQWPDANIGVRAGNGLFVLDADCKSDGLETLQDLTTGYGQFPSTPMANTGSGGEHYYFSVEGHCQSSVSKVGRGIDIRCDGGYVVAPPSRHWSRRPYYWDPAKKPGEIALAPVPEWLVALARKAQHVEVVREPGRTKVPVGERNDTLARTTWSLRQTGLGEAAVLAALLSSNATDLEEPLPEKEVEKIVEQAFKKQPTSMTVLPVMGASDYDGNVKAIRPGAVDDSWMTELRHGDHGELRKEAPNATLYMVNHPSIAGKLRYNDFSQRIIWVGELPDEVGLTPPQSGAELCDADIVYVQALLSKMTGTYFQPTVLVPALEAAAKAAMFHPVRDWLNGLEWDGQLRIGTWLERYMGAYPTPFVHEVGHRWLISAVARVFSPGCQADHVLVLEGAEGNAKSTGLRTLCGADWYLESLPDIRWAKEVAQALLGHWVVEIAELDAIRGANATRVKDFLTQKVDEFRPAYGRFTVKRPRQCVFAATTNEHQWLDSTTGGRRFWPVRAGEVDRDAIARDRDQLWAEAVVSHHAGINWWPDRESVAMFQDEQEERHQHDAWESVIGAWASSRYEFSMNDVLECALGLTRDKWERNHQVRTGRLLQRLGYSKRKEQSEGSRVYVYRKQEVGK